MHGLTKAQRVCLSLVAVGFIAAGTLHFIRPQPYIRIMPPYLPWAAQLVAISGFFEILGGAGILMARFRPPARWGLVALLIAVFPANIHLALHPTAAGMNMPAALLWARLPLQAVLIWLVLWSTRPHAQN